MLKDGIGSSKNSGVENPGEGNLVWLSDDPVCFDSECKCSVGRGVSVIPLPLRGELALFRSHEDTPSGTFLSSPASTAAFLPPALISERGEQPLICLRHQAVSQAGFNDCP